MDSPFPGMDPYLDSRWRSVHHRLVTYAADQLQQALPRRFRVELEMREIDAKDGEYSDAYIEITDGASGNRVVTAIEFLSPTNKISGHDNDLYLRKQRLDLSRQVTRIEIDLTREGDRNLVL